MGSFGTLPKGTGSFGPSTRRHSALSAIRDIHLAPAELAARTRQLAEARHVTFRLPTSQIAVTDCELIGKLIDSLGRERSMPLLPQCRHLAFNGINVIVLASNAARPHKYIARELRGATLEGKRSNESSHLINLIKRDARYLSEHIGMARALVKDSTRRTSRAIAGLRGK